MWGAKKEAKKEAKDSAAAGKPADPTAAGPVSIFFDMAEAMENGGGRGLVGDLARPLPMWRTTEQQEKMTMLTCKEQGWSKLVSAGSETLLIAKPAEGDAAARRFNIYVLRTSKKQLAPKFLFSRSFSLQKGRDGREWTLTSLCCERCEARGRRMCGIEELARFRCTAQASGGRKAAGLAQLDVEMPALNADGDRACTCTKCGTSTGVTWVTEFSSRTTSSAKKEFELAPASSAGGGSLGETSLLRVSKVDDTKSTFECQAPLCLLHAFCAAVVAAKQ